MRGAIVGFGEVALHGHWPAYSQSDQLSIVAIVDRSGERRKLAEALSPGLRAYATLDALAGAETLDFVDVCTPPALHGDPVIASLERGWHVVCEKPFLIDAGLLARARRAAEAHGVAAVPVHNWKQAPIVRDATARLVRGDIGRLERVEIETERLRDFKGADPERPNWRRDPAIAGGGILMDHGWHALYLALDWFGAEPSSVEAVLHRPSPDAVEDEARVRLRFPHGDASIVLTWNGTARRNTMRLTGDRGSIDIADDRLVIRGSHGDEEVAYPVALSGGSHHADWFETLIPQIAGCFRNPTASRAAFDEAAACYRIIRRAYDNDRRDRT
jgi:predicted dehydrogenase